MANDMQWPSEDEDFDAVTTPEVATPRRRVTRNAQANDTARTIVAATEPDQPVQEQEELDHVPAPAQPARTVKVSSYEDETPEPQHEEIDPVEAAFADDVEDNAQYYEQEQQVPQQQTLSRKERKAAEKAENEAAKAAAYAAAEQERAAARAEAKTAQAEADAQAAREEAAYAAEQAQAEREAAERPAPVQQAPKAPKQPRTPGKHTGVFRTIFELALVVALLGVGYYAVMLHQDKQDLNAKVATLNNNPQLAVQRQTDTLISNVGSLMTLPQGEVPTVANVSDAAKAKQQSSFFANAQNGDKVLMYVKAGQAILYRPDTNKIILVAPLTFNSNTTATPTTTKTTR